jgi:hypothetical protein
LGLPLSSLSKFPFDGNPLSGGISLWRYVGEQLLMVKSGDSWAAGTVLGPASAIRAGAEVQLFTIRTSAGKDSYFDHSLALHELGRLEVEVKYESAYGEEELVARFSDELQASRPAEPAPET